MGLASDRRVLVPASMLALLGAGVAVFFAVAVRVSDCNIAAGAECSTLGFGQAVVACLGVIPALVFLVQSVRGRAKFVALVLPDCARLRGVGPISVARLRCHHVCAVAARWRDDE